MWLIPDRDVEVDQTALQALDWEAIGRMVRLRTVKAMTVQFALLAALAEEEGLSADHASE